uniref:Uncharacterized protein n=1 Tax=Rhizophora mucronata TaxID=61149 RepID=A0A2P2MZW3_RHIMU
MLLNDKRTCLKFCSVMFINCKLNKFSCKGNKNSQRFGN